MVAHQMRRDATDCDRRGVANFGAGYLPQVWTLDAVTERKRESSGAASSEHACFGADVVTGFRNEAARQPQMPVLAGNATAIQL